MKPAPAKASAIAQSLLVFALFWLLTYLGNLRPLWLNVASLSMLLLPPLWAWRTRSWRTMGFTVANLGPALSWGAGGGLLSALIGLLVIGQVNIPADLPLQLAVGVPMWLFIASPFQEFFFRGWLQTRLEATLGPWPGLLAALACFTLWHFALPIFGPQSAFAMYTFSGILGTVISGFIYSYLFLRTRNLFAPTLAHALAGIAFVVIGAASFLPAPIVN